MEKKFKYPIIKSSMRPFWYITDRIKTFMTLSFVFTFIMVFLSYTFGQTFLCSVSEYRNAVGCLENLWAYALYMVLKLFVLSVFLRIWYDTAYMQKKVSEEYFKENKVAFIKFFVCMVLFILWNLLPTLSSYLLLIRVPNPVWQREVLYFTVVSIGFVLPIISLRFYANLAEFIEQANWKNFKQVYKKTQYQFPRMLISTLFVFIFAFIAFIGIMSNLRTHIAGNIHVYNLFAEIVFEWTVLLISTLIINMIRVQKETLFSETIEK